MLGLVDEDELIGLYQHAHALVYLSRFGPENLPPLEALALGCPAIVANVPGRRRAARRRGADRRPRRSPPAVADAIQRVGQKPERRSPRRGGSCAGRLVDRGRLPPRLARLSRRLRAGTPALGLRRGVILPRVPAAELRHAASPPPPRASCQGPANRRSGEARLRERLLLNALRQHYASRFRREWLWTDEPPHFFDHRIGAFDLAFGSRQKRAVPMVSGVLRRRGDPRR